MCLHFIQIILWAVIQITNQEEIVSLENMTLDKLSAIGKPSILPIMGASLHCGDPIESRFETRYTAPHNALQSYVSRLYLRGTVLPGTPFTPYLDKNIYFGLKTSGF